MYSTHGHRNHCSRWCDLKFSLIPSFFQLRYWIAPDWIYLWNHKNSFILHSDISYSFDSHSVTAISIFQLHTEKLFNLFSLLFPYQHLHYFTSFLLQLGFMVHDFNHSLANKPNFLAEVWSATMSARQKPNPCSMLAAKQLSVLTEKSHNCRLMLL